MNMDFQRKLPIPAETKKMYPLTDDAAQTVRERTEALRRIFDGRDAQLAGRMSMNIYLTERGKTNGDGSENGGSYFEEGRIKV